MAKSASIITFLFAALVLFAAFEAPTKVEAQKLCEKPSGTMLERCLNNSNACKVQCITLEGARHGSCSNFPSYKCICHFPC